MNTLETKLYTLIKSRIGADVLIFADQNAPRPALPYWTMRLQSVRKLGMDYHSQGVTVGGDETVSGTREGTVAMQYHGSGAVLKCMTLRDDLARTTAQDQWRLNDIACFNAGEVQNVPFLLDNEQLEPRSAIDLFIRFGSTLTDNVGVIETVIADGEYATSGSIPNPDLDQIISIMLGISGELFVNNMMDYLTANGSDIQLSSIN